MTETCSYHSIDYFIYVFITIWVTHVVEIGQIRMFVIVTLFVPYWLLFILFSKLPCCTSLWITCRPEIIAYVLSLKKECSSFWSLSCRSPGRLHQTTICAYELAFKTLTSEFGCKRLKTRVSARKYSISSIARTKSCAGTPFGPDDRKGRYMVLPPQI